jgi:NADPH:quinone reductase-like Zn-dependent oxidoreductase
MRAVPLVTITAWETLPERARVSAGQLALVQAGAGGVGHLSVQIARLAGARVATTVRPGPKAELAASLGAARVYASTQLLSRVAHPEETSHARRIRARRTGGRGDLDPAAGGTGP